MDSKERWGEWDRHSTCKSAPPDPPPVGECEEPGEAEHCAMGTAGHGSQQECFGLMFWVKLEVQSSI